MFQYFLSDVIKFSSMPWQLIAQATKQSMTKPINPLSYDAMGKIMAANIELFSMSSNPISKPTFGIHKTNFRGDSIKVQEITISKTPFADLVFFERISKNPETIKHISKDPKILIVPPMLGHYSTLMRDVVKDMLPSHNVFIIDWADAKMVPLVEGYFDLDDQIEYLMNVIKKLGSDVHIISVSQSSISAFCAIALLAAENEKLQPRSISLLGGPIDARSNSCVVEKSQKHCALSWYRKNRIEMVPYYYPAAFRRVYAGENQLQHRMSMVLDSGNNDKIKYFDYLTRGSDETPSALNRLYKEFLAVMDVTEEFYIQLMEKAYRNCDLPNNAYIWHGKKVDPSKITKTAVFTIEGELDNLSPQGHTSAALKMCNNLDDNKKQSHLEIGIRHYGLFSGKKWRQNIQPLIHSFIRTNSYDDDNEKFYTIKN